MKDRSVYKNNILKFSKYIQEVSICDKCKEKDCICKKENETKKN